MAMNAFKNRESYNVAAGWVRDLQAWSNHNKSISSGTIFVIKLIPYALAIDKCTTLVEYPVGLLCCNLLLHASEVA